MDKSNDSLITKHLLNVVSINQITCLTILLYIMITSSTIALLILLQSLPIDGYISPKIAPRTGSENQLTILMIKVIHHAKKWNWTNTSQCNLFFNLQLSNQEICLYNQHWLHMSSLYPKRPFLHLFQQLHLSIMSNSHNQYILSILTSVWTMDLFQAHPAHRLIRWKWILCHLH